jgi:hypothetical protein
LDPEHTGFVTVQSDRSVVVHSTQAPELAQARLFGQLLPLQATQDTPSQIGVLPLHWALLLHAVHAGLPELFVHALLTHV